MKPAVIALIVALSGALWGSETAAQAAKATADDASKDRAPTIRMWVDTLSGQRARVCVLAEAAGDSVTKIELSLRGRPHQSTRRGFGTSEGCRTNALKFEVPLAPGTNVIEAVAFASNTPSRRVRAEVTGYSAQRNQRLWILTVGIDTYPNPANRLRYARNDGRAFAAALKERAESLYKDVRIISLSNREATKTAIRERLEMLARDSVKANDTFVFFFAGHGTIAAMNEDSEDDFYLVGADVTNFANGPEVIKGGISPAELEASLRHFPKSAKRLVVLDACQSGEMVDHFAEKGRAAADLEAAGMRVNTVILTAVGPSQPAVELESIRHGLFTKALLDALADRSNGPPQVRTISFLADEAAKHVAILADEYRQDPDRRPQMLSSRHNFEIILR